MVEEKPRSWQQTLLYALLFVLFLYLFLLSIQLMGSAFKYFGKGFAEQLLTTTSNPFNGLFIGLLATAVGRRSIWRCFATSAIWRGGRQPANNAMPTS